METNGYVTFVNNNPIYLELTNILVESVLNFSDKPIEVFAINFDYIHSSDRVISRRIDVQNENFATICYSKLYSTLNSSFDYGIQLDADFIITKDMDKLFEDAKKIIDKPLGSLHPSDPNNQKNIMDYLGVTEKSQPYVHATYLFSKDCKPFFQECYDFSNWLYSKNIAPQNYDETIYNVMLWKHKSNSIVDCYDPYYAFFLDHNQKETCGYGWMENVNFYSCHGIKDPLFAKTILEKMINENK